MKKVIGFDISLTCIGYSVLEYDTAVITLVRYGNIKPPGSDKGSLAFRCLSASKEIKKLLAKENPDSIAIESYAQSFAGGKTTARTLLALGVINETTQITILDMLGFEPELLAVSSIRSIISKHLGKRSISKEEMIDVVKTSFSSFVPRITRNGTIAAEAYDESDGIAVGYAFCIKHQKD